MSKLSPSHEAAAPLLKGQWVEILFSDPGGGESKFSDSFVTRKMTSCLKPRVCIFYASSWAGYEVRVSISYCFDMGLLDGMHRLCASDD